MSQVDPILLQSAQLLEMFARQTGHGYDRQRAQRLLLESSANRSPTDLDSVGPWYQRVVSCAEVLEIRIREVSLSLDEVTQLAADGLPLALMVERAAQPHWVVVNDSSRRGLRVTDLQNSQTQWLSPRQFQKRWLASGEKQVNWLVCQGALLSHHAEQHLLEGGHRLPFGHKNSSGAHGSPSASQGGNDASHHHGHHGPPPLRRLLGFLRPDVADLWTILVFSLVVGILTLTTPIAVEALVNTVAFGRFVQPVVILSLIVFVFLAFSSALSAITIYVAEIMQRRLFVRVAEDLAYRIPRLEQRQTDSEHVPELLNRFFDIVTVQKSVAKLLLDGLAIVLQTIIGMAVLAFYHPFLLGFDIVLLLLIAFTLFGLGRGAVRTAIGESIAKYDMAAWLQELGRHPHAFKLHQGTALAIDRADHLAISWLEARKRHFRIVMRQVIFAFLIYCLATTVLLGLGGWLVIVGQLSLGQLVAAELIVILIVRSFTKLGKHMESIYDLLAAVDKLGVILDLEMESHDRFTNVTSDEPVALKFENVRLTLDHQTIFDHLQLSIPAGQITGIQGPTGSGKSNLMELCCGLRQPEHGRILWNGIDLREIRIDSIRSATGVAGEPQIFLGTVDENIRLNRPQLDSAWLRELIQAIGLNDLIARLPSGINTTLQTNGFPLTRSQCRLITLARALASRPALLIIDGLLDHLSTDQARTILQFLEKRTQSTTLVLTARDDIAQLCQHLQKIGKPG